MWRDALAVAAKDLRIEARSRVLTTQVLPFGLLVLLLFGFGISPDLAVVGVEDRSVLTQVTPGLFWLAVVFSALSALARAFAVEAANGSLDGLRLAGADPAGVFLGKAGAVMVQLLVLETVLGAGALLLFGAGITHPGLLAATAVSTTLAIAASGTLYAAVASGTRLRDTIVPLLVLPALAPVLLGAVQATEAALFGPAVDGWRWLGVIGLFTALYGGAGTLSFATLMEEA